MPETYKPVTDDGYPKNDSSSFSAHVYRLANRQPLFGFLLSLAGYGEEKMSATIKILSIVFLFGAALGLAILCQPSTDGPIYVTVATSPQGIEHGQKIMLKAVVNGRGVSHGNVRLDFAPTTPKNLVSFSGDYHSIKGYTDRQGVFTTTWPASQPGEYMVIAAVSKAGWAHGETVSFLRVPEPRQHRRMAESSAPNVFSTQHER